MDGATPPCQNQAAPTSPRPARQAQEPPGRGPAVGGPARAGWMGPLVGLMDPVVPSASAILRLPWLLFRTWPCPALPSTRGSCEGQAFSEPRGRYLCTNYLMLFHKSNISGGRGDSVAMKPPTAASRPLSGGGGFAPRSRPVWDQQHNGYWGPVAGFGSSLQTALLLKHHEIHKNTDGSR